MNDIPVTMMACDVGRLRVIPATIVVTVEIPVDHQSGTDGWRLIQLLALGGPLNVTFDPEATP